MKASYHFRLSLLATLVAAHTSAMAEDKPMEHITVVGQAVSMDRALKKQRSSDSISNVVHSDGIAQLPDDNAAEALQRIPGLSVERDQGEGRFVRVRGVAPDLNSVTINGTLVPAPEADRRAVALDVLPSELVQSLSVVKTLTPDMDANSLGGTIEVESMSAFDHGDLFYTGTLEGSYDDNTGETSPKLSGAISNVFSVGDGQENLGVAFAFSWQEREFGSDNTETGGGWDFENGAGLEEFELRDYALTRERMGLGLNFDYKADAQSRYFLRTLFSEFTDTETRHSVINEFADPVMEGATEELEAQRELKDREETQEITSVVIGGEKLMGLWTVSAQAGYSQASEDTPDHIASAIFAAEDAIANAGFSSTTKPYPIVPGSYFSADSYVLDEVEVENQIAEDTEKNIKLDFTREFAWNNNPSELKFGAKVSRREKTNDTNVFVYEDLGDQGFTDAQLKLSQFQSGQVDYNLGNFGPAINGSALTGFLSGAQSERDIEESGVNDYTINEDINAAYLMNTLDLDAWRIIVGLRYEGTDVESSGFEFNADTDALSTVDHQTSYDHWLPGLHARYQINSDTQIRMAWSNVVVRPTFEETAPGIVIDDTDYSAGNPDLKPLESSNLDFGIEYFLGKAGVVSVFVFYKNIDNFIFETDLAGAPGIDPVYEEFVTYANGDSAQLFGMEFAYSQQLSWLEGPMSGVILGANLTVSDSEADIDGYVDGAANQRSIRLPNHSETVGNVMVGWENQQWSLRLSANYKSKYLDEVGGFDSEQADVWADEQTIVDFSGRYFIAENIQVSFEALNLTDEPYYTYVYSRKYNSQYEEYGPTYKLGLTFTQF
ncbi:MAG: TonB-dependent receptor [Pseudomonadales bacterium]|nr:TonB-dependent receptor [Pseudomonadales bacterium]